MPREGGTGRQPHCLHHRQPEREERRKRGPCIDPHGYDAGKKIKGKKRHVLVDTLGLLLHAIVHPAVSRIATAASCCSRRCSGCIPSCRRCSPMPAIREGNSTTRSRQPCLTFKRKSSSVQIRPRDSSCCPSAGLLSARWRGSTAVEGWPKIGKTSTA